MTEDHTTEFLHLHEQWINFIEQERCSYDHDGKSWVVYLPPKDSEFDPIIEFALEVASAEWGIPLKLHRGHGVVVAPGQTVGKHHHGHLYTFLYYVEPGEAKAPIYTVDPTTGEEYRLTPEPGMYLNYTQRIKHGVDKNEGEDDRYSIAILMEEDGVETEGE